MGWYIFETFVNTLEICVSLYLAECLFYRRNSKPVPLLFRMATVVAGVASLLLCAYGNTGIPDIVPGIVIFIVYSVFLLKAPFLPAVLWSFINCAIIGICTFACITLLSTLFKKPDIDIFFVETSHRILFLVLCQTIRISLTVLLARWFGKRKTSVLLRKGWWLFVGIPLFSIYTLLMLAEYDSIGFGGNTPAYVNISIFIGLLTINIGLLFFFEEISRASEEAVLAKARSETLAMQLRHQEEMRQMQKDIRTIKHDMNNHLYTLRGYADMKQYDRLDAYLQDLTEHFEIHTSYLSTGNLAIDALLRAKVSLAQSRGIRIEVIADLPGKMNIAEDHLCVLIGNLFDNAYDACMRMGNECERFIKIDLKNQKGNLSIHFVNTTDGREKRKEHSWVSLKQGSKDHGYGLQSIDSIVNQYGGYCERSHANGLFICSIILPLEDSDDQAHFVNA